MQSQPLTSATNSDGIPSKDGLGPKIWTGTHFLPRFVRAAEVPGEGLCFFYDDGSHCKTIIDGEQVNAHWGVTKAGKPRKRLAIACVTCREKKIKCDPDFPRCVQCEKFGRVCKFKNAPRGGHNTSPSTAAAEPEDVRRMGGSASEMHRPGSNSSASVSPRTTLRQPRRASPGSIASLMSFLPSKTTCSTEHGNQIRDLMLIYSILAVGVALSGGPKNIANEYAQIAHYAQHRAACSLQLAQARLLLALYYLSLSRLNDANELISGAISASIDLQLNLELEKSNEADLTDFPYGLQKDGYSESRRRTYWACFVLERLSGVFPNRLSILNVKDIFIRLPCDNELFERQAKSDASFFPAAMAMSSKAVIRPLGILAFLVQLVAIWGEAMSELYRAAQSQETDYDAAGFIDTVMEKLIGWRESLPECFTYSSGNMALATQDGTLSTFLTIHLVYLHGLMKIHRHVRTEPIAASVRLQYGTRIHEEATRVLDITGMLEVLLQGRRAPISAPPPFMSYVILEATDVLTAEGSLAEVSVLLDRLAVAGAIVDAAGMVWEEARAHQSAMEQRLDALRALRDRQPSDAPLAGSRVFDHDESKDSKLPAGRCWQMDDPMDTIFPRRMDLVYNRS
ncbi:putative transcriptional regulatory protein [Colletotrichum fructicola]|nr:putative transcriptional regulatory protein [Colletotrichum fructicola]